MPHHTTLSNTAPTPNHISTGPLHRNAPDRGESVDAPALARWKYHTALGEKENGPGRKLPRAKGSKVSRLQDSRAYFFLPGGGHAEVAVRPAVPVVADVETPRIEVADAHTAAERVHLDAAHPAIL